MHTPISHVSCTLNLVSRHTFTSTTQVSCVRSANTTATLRPSSYGSFQLPFFKSSLKLSLSHSPGPFSRHPNALRRHFRASPVQAHSCHNGLRRACCLTDASSPYIPSTETPLPVSVQHFASESYASLLSHHIFDIQYPIFNIFNIQYSFIYSLKYIHLLIYIFIDILIISYLNVFIYSIISYINEYIYMYVHIPQALPPTAETPSSTAAASGPPRGWPPSAPRWACAPSSTCCGVS